MTAEIFEEIVSLQSIQGILTKLNPRCKVADQEPNR
jgi:hypothetical protein